MDELLQRQNIAVNTDLDRVVLSVNRLSFPMPYADGFKIAGHMRLACKRCMRECGESIKDWRKRSEITHVPEVAEISPVRRTTLTRRFNWSVGGRGEMVVLMFGNITLEIHFSDALRLATWLRVGARQAKLWAGDQSKTVMSLARLSDAEENYKRGFN